MNTKCGFFLLVHIIFYIYICIIDIGYIHHTCIVVDHFINMDASPLIPC